MKKTLYKAYNIVTVLLNKIYIKRTIKKIRRYKEMKKIILIGSPLHGNLGDHAIAAAQLEFIKNNVTDYVLIEFPGSKFEKYKQKLLFYSQQNDIILITGGGFLGDLWIHEEQMVRSVIHVFKDNKIIIMPQTIFFKHDGVEKQISKSIYESHRNLHICLRDKQSYNFVKHEFSNIQNIYYAPDIVLYLNKSFKGQRNNSIAFCFRSDKEKLVDNSQINQLSAKANHLGYKINYITTISKFSVPIYLRQRFLNNILKQFYMNKLVITDRLHGMIFCAITGTPCIAFDNLTGKVKGVHKWIEDLDYIKFVDKKCSLDQIMETLLHNQNKSYYFNNKNYDDMKKLLQK